MKKEFLDKDLPPFLKDLKGKGEGYKVPDKYFDNLEDAVFARLEAVGDMARPALEGAKRLGYFPLFIRPRTAIALAAALALVLAAVWFLRQPSTATPQTGFVSIELTEDDLESYVLENVHEFEPEQLAALTPDETDERTDETTPLNAKKNSRDFEEIHPDDLDKILDEMTDEELEQIL